LDPAIEREFTEFVVARGPTLLRAAYRLTGNRDDADDLLQTALAKTFVKWSHISVKAEHYVKRVLYRDWVSLQRRLETPTAQPLEGSYGDASDNTLLWLVLRDALLALPRHQRAVIVLRYLHGLDERQVAQLLGCSPSTISAQAARGRSRLRRSIEPAKATCQPSFGRPS
jgi:RNA polymerase sigma-70 factor (sigma-E family)